jgi:sugar (pentulose or hexulose) kinase
MTQDCVLTIDAGTSVLKGAVLDSTGTQLAFAEVTMTILHPFEGACEMDMNAVWEGFCGVCRQLATAVPNAWSRLVGVAITGQGDGLWPLDSDGQPLGHAILWNDSRCKDSSLTHDPEIVQFSQKYHCSQLFSAASPVLLRWMKAAQPDRFERLGHVLHCKDWLVYRLTGAIMTDRSDASTSMFNILDNRYEFDLLDLLGLEKDVQRLFPPVHPSMALVGCVSPSGGQASDVPIGIPVMAGSIDLAAAAFGAGARQPGDAITILGTTFTNQVILSREMVDHTDTAGSILYHVYPGRYIRVMSPTNGAGVTNWARQHLARNMPFETLEARLEQIPAGADGLFFLPYLNGERAPIRNAMATGSFHGITVKHTTWHILRAVYEAMVYSIRDCHTHLPPGETPVRLCGGASVSALLCQMTADVLNRPAIRVPSQEFGLLGMAAAFWEAMGRPLPAEHENTPFEYFHPDPYQAKIYDRGFEIYQALREGQQSFWQTRDIFCRHLLSNRGC